MNALEPPEPLRRRERVGIDASALSLGRSGLALDHGEGALRVREPPLGESERGAWGLRALRARGVEIGTRDVEVGGGLRPRPRGALTLAGQSREQLRGRGRPRPQLLEQALDRRRGLDRGRRGGVAALELTHHVEHHRE